MAKTCSIGLRSGEYFGRKNQLGAGLSDGLAHGLSFVRAEIVKDDDVAGLESGDEDLLDIGQEPLAVDRSIDQERRVDAVMTERGEESRCLPMAVRDLVDQPLASRRPSMGARHIGLGPGFVDEDQAGRIDPLLILAPLGAAAAYVRAILLARHQRLFLKLILLVDKGPHRPIVHLEAALREPGHQPPQRVIAPLDPLPQPSFVLAPDRTRLVPAHLTRRDAAGFRLPAHPVDRRADRLESGQRPLHRLQPRFVAAVERPLLDALATGPGRPAPAPAGARWRSAG